MSNRIESFPMLNENIVSELNIDLITLKGEYNLNNSIYKLDFIRDNENNDYVLDNNGMWTSDTNDLHILGEFKIGNYNILFDEYNLAKKDTILGVSLTYISIGSSKTYTKSIAELTYQNNDEKTIQFSLDFEEGELASILSLKFSIYVKNVQKDNNSVLAQNAGTVLGEVYNCNLLIEGQGSEFPIVIIESPESPLWDMEVDFESFDDIFSKDTICLKINKAHKQFSKLGVDKISLNNNLVWKEILASFFENIFLVAQQIEDIETIYDEQFQEGTIGGFLKFMLTTFNISQKDLRNPTILSMQIRKELDNLL